MGKILQYIKITDPHKYLDLIPVKILLVVQNFNIALKKAV